MGLRLCFFLALIVMSTGCGSKIFPAYDGYFGATFLHDYIYGVGLK